MSKKELIAIADRAYEEGLNIASIAGAMRRFVEAGEIDLAERARRLLDADARKRGR